jgi:hypothetical protein
MSLLQPLVLRRPLRAALSAALLGLSDLVLTGLLINAGSLTGALFLAAALAVMVYGTVGAARARIEVDHDGVVVRNGWRVRRIPWTDVVFISPATDDPAFRTVGVATRNGPRIRCFAVGAMRWESTESPVQRRMYQQLHQRLVAARAAGLAPDHG